MFRMERWTRFSSLQIFSQNSGSKRRGADGRRESGGKFASGRISFSFLKILQIVGNSKRLTMPGSMFTFIESLLSLFLCIDHFL